MSSCFSLLLQAVLATGVSSKMDSPDEVVDALKQAKEVAVAGKFDEAELIASKVIREHPKDPRPQVFLGNLFDVRGKHDDAIAAYTRAIAIDAKSAEAYDLRGSAQFKRGKFKESVADFDHYLELRPLEAPGHWRRGISLYYAGKYAEGRDQFKKYEIVDTNDVENAIWNFLCAAKVDGVAKARAAMLKIGKDKRVPMMEVYELYQGKLKPEDVLAAVEAGEASDGERKLRRFYAHLYLGLYYDATGDAKKAAEHMNLAGGPYRSPQYMGEVARVHMDLLAAQAGK